MHKSSVLIMFHALVDFMCPMTPQCKTDS